MPTASIPDRLPPEPPWTVRVARFASRAGMAGVLVQWTAFLLWMASDLLGHSSGGVWIGLLSLTVLAGVTLVPIAVPWAGVQAAAGRPGGRTVLWVFGPLAVVVNAALCVTDLVLLTEDNLSLGARLFPAAGLPGALLVLLALPVAAAALATPSARRYLAGFRRPEHSRRGRRAVTIAAFLLGATVALSTAAAVLVLRARAAIAYPEWALPRDDPEPYLVAAAVLAAVTASAELVFLAAAVTTRRTGSRAIRALAFGLGMATLVLVPPGVYAIALAVEVAAGELAGDATRSAGIGGLALYVIAAAVHVLVVTLLASPSVSTWVARPTPEPAPEPDDDRPADGPPNAGGSPSTEDRPATEDPAAEDPAAAERTVLPAGAEDGEAPAEDAPEPAGPDRDESPAVPRGEVTPAR
ncbi:hypothetical protein [Cryptosporangium minutisporangium]|uniref:Integral membrane protein n=1 Tax=Cryptosporangium minutisporangium TaxID=113569 RepID=A0ABP6TA77_9ACTN